MRLPKWSLASLERLNHIMRQQWWRFLVLSLASFPSVAAIVVEKKGIERGTSVITVIVLAITASIIFWYTVETYRLRKSTSQSNTFSALTQVHGTFSNEMSYSAREYLHTHFSATLAQVTKKVLGDQYVDSEGEAAGLRVNLTKVLNQLKEDRDLLRQFNKELASQTARKEVERVLLDFDVVALPLHLKIKPAREIAEAYKPIFERTAEPILEFVAIQKKLRGASDPYYKAHYLALLKELGIDLRGLEVPSFEGWVKPTC